MLGLADAVPVQPQPIPQQPAQEVHVQQPSIVDTTHFNPSWGYDLNLLSHAASHVALEGEQENLESIRKASQSQNVSQPLPPAPERAITDSYGVEPSFLDLTDLGDPVQDFTVFLESVGLSSDWDSGVFSSVEEPMMPTGVPIDSKLSMRETAAARLGPDMMSDTRHTADDGPSFSNFGSRLPSLQPEPHDLDDRIGFTDDSPRPAWDISNTDRQIFISKLEEFAYVLPRNFVPPSRHTLARFFAGYINGLNEHLPFIHVPTLSVSKCSPELTLALAAAGSHYRFENNRGIELFHAAKAILLERLRRRDSKQVACPTWSFYSPNPPDDFHKSRDSSIISNHASSPFQHHQYMAGNPMDYAAYTLDDSDAHMEVIRTFLLLTVFASWERHPELLREILSLQSTLARLVREHGLSEPFPSPEPNSWEEWIRGEGNRRTKLIVYCFFNLHSIMYNIPPLILNAELYLNMPCSPDVWKANNAVQWRRVYRARSGTEVSFQEAFAKLFLKSGISSSSAPISPLGNYILIHAIIQQIFFARQLCLSAPTMQGTSLRQDDLSVLDHSLTSWKALWKRTPESSIDPQNPAGPIAFTSTALLGLAYIRLHVDMGPCRRLITQDPIQIARALNDSPPIARSPRLIMALLHSAHALSIPVRLGIDFVARTHSFFWSIQHSLCSLECAFLLSRWLLLIPVTQAEQRLTEHERKLLLWIKSMMDETDMAVDPPGAPDVEFLASPYKARQLSVAIVRVWARTFKGNTSWAIVDLVGSSLDTYADLLEAQS